MLTLESLYATSFSRLRSVAARYVRWQDTEDVVQDAFVRAHEHRGTFDARAALGTWVHRIVINAAIDAGRLNGRHARIEDRSPRGRLAAVACSSELKLVLGCALNSLSATEREICLLHDVAGYSHREIASMLGIPVGTSKWRLSRARRRLRAQLEGPRAPE